MDTSIERTGVLVLRVWSEHASLRARITRTVDIEKGDKVVTVVGSAEEIKATVADWLQHFATTAGVTQV